MELITERLLLKPIMQDYQHDIFLHFTKDVTKYMYPKPPKDLTETIQFIDQCIENYNQNKAIIFVVLNIETHEFLGLMGIHEINTKTPEIGLWLKKASQGYKYGVEGISKIIAYANEKLDYDYIIYNCDRRNIASRSIPESLNGIPMKTYTEKNLSQVDLHYIQYRIYKEFPKNMKKPMILCQGDSITDCGRNRDDHHSLGHGYVKKISDYMKYCNVINKGISGHRTIDLLERWQKDCIDLKPDIITILIGINEIWHRYKYGKVLTPSTFKTYYTKLLERIKQELPQSKILLIEPFVFPIGEYDSKWEKDLIEEQKIVNELAKKYADDMIPMQSILNKSLEYYRMEELLPDGVHPSDLGHEIMAKAVRSKLVEKVAEYLSVVL